MERVLILNLKVRSNYLSPFDSYTRLEIKVLYQVCFMILKLIGSKVTNYTSRRNTEYELYAMLHVILLGYSSVQISVKSYP